jgi:hypothetical protein
MTLLLVVQPITSNISAMPNPSSTRLIAPSVPGSN